MKSARKASISPTLGKAVAAAIAAGLLAVNAHAQADSAAESSSYASQTKTYDIPAGSLTQALNRFAKTSGIPLAFEPAMVEGKETRGLKGRFGIMDGFSELLKGSGLEAVSDQRGGYFLDKVRPLPASNGSLPDLGETIATDVVNVRASRFKQVGPMPGLALTREEIPGNVQTITAEEIRESKAMTIAELFNSRLQSVNVNDYQGNPFQMDITYRGFTAGPQIGMPQGLSVFFDGVRVNEPFGDVVNWDLIPMNALASVDVFPGSNPVFGLNTLGGAVAMRTKNGFDDPGTEIQVLGGSFGRKQVMMSTGGSKGNVAGFFALNRFEEDGWRDNSPSKVMQVFGKASFRTDNVDLHGSVTYAGNDLIGNGLVPEEMYEKDHESVFTSPDKTKNDLLQFQVAGAFQVNDTFSITGQMYRRKSDRKAVTGDINRDFADGEFGNNRYATRRPLAGENPVCAFASTNQYGIPDYYLSTDAGGVGWAIFGGVLGDGDGDGVADAPMDMDGDGDLDSFDLDNDGDYDLNDALALWSNIDAVNGGFNMFGVDPATFNMTLDATSEFIDAIRAYEQYMFTGEQGGEGTGIDYTTNDLSALYKGFVTAPGGWSYTLLNSNTSYFTDGGGQVLYFVPTEPLNGPNCGLGGTYDNAKLVQGQIRVGPDGNIVRNGAWDSSNAGTGSGYVDGTPTAVLTSVDIGQIIRGGSMQFNWDTDRHKLMLGTSLDYATNTYSNSQLLALLNDQREAYLAPDEIGAEFAAARFPVANNEFSGSSKTRSAYISETFTPVESFHFSASARYNYTRVMTNMRVRRNTEDISISSLSARWMQYLLCDGAALEDCNQYLLNNPVPEPGAVAGSENLGGQSYFDGWEREVATYHKINPSVGASWSPRNNLNVYGNWSQGTRTPSAIELGCAFDDTVVTINTLSGPKTGPRSLINGRTCTLPTALSGDPYLPQIVARTLEFGLRGKLVNGWDWNASIYNTNLQDDIYFVAYTATKSFFDTIGKTRRRGLEMGVGGKEGKWDFRVNYSLTDATFETMAKIANADNSSVNHNSQLPDWNMMTISPGDRMPGIPLHNINLKLGFQATDKWHIGLSMVAHSWSYARGNENNKHRGGTYQDIPISDLQGGTVTLRRHFKGDGKTPGYAVFNLNTSYDFGNGWIANLTVNNLLDKDYFSASRIDINPFTAPINGAIGPGGFNYNSNEWNATTFVAPGAPRAAWFTLKYDFNADKRR